MQLLQCRQCCCVAGVCHSVLVLNLSCRGMPGFCCCWSAWDQCLWVCLHVCKCMGAAFIGRCGIFFLFPSSWSSVFKWKFPVQLSSVSLELCLRRKLAGIGNMLRLQGCWIISGNKHYWYWNPYICSLSVCLRNSWSWLLVGFAENNENALPPSYKPKFACEHCMC